MKYTSKDSVQTLRTQTRISARQISELGQFQTKLINENHALREEILRVTKLYNELARHVNQKRIKTKGFPDKLRELEYAEALLFGTAIPNQGE